MTQIYNDPAGGQESTVGSQFNTFYWQKKALIEAAKEQYFGQMADTTSMPKNMGKTIKKYHYLPLLDDANINDQGIDAAGASVTQRVTFRFTAPGANDTGSGYVSHYLTGEGANEAAAISDAKAKAQSFFANLVNHGFPAWNTSYALTVGDAQTAGWSVTDDTESDHGNGVATSVAESGNLYGSSKDVGAITAKLPALSETGGRVNRVGFKRIELEGSIEKFGFFEEYTKESLDFDTDAELEMHINREMIMGANEITEDALQIDLLNGAGVLRFGGIATGTTDISGESGEVSEISYEDLMRLSIDLDNNRCPKNTKLITGSRMVDTRVVNGARYMYIGSELIPMVKKMTDTFSNQAFVSVEKYAAGGTVARGEIGQVDQFKIIVVPEMMHWAGAGKAVTTNTGYRETGGNYDVYPMLVVGSESFTTIGFQTDGKTVKFKIKHSKPESNTAYSKDDPYGELGFMSIKWYYGSMLLRPERIALVKCVAEW